MIYEMLLCGMRISGHRPVLILLRVPKVAFHQLKNISVTADATKSLSDYAQP